MTNEQTQAERLAKKFLDTHATMTSPEYSGTARYESNRIQVNWLTDLITQATAELRAENERLENFGKIHAKAADHEILALRKKLSQAETERDQAQAQVAALVSDLEKIREDLSKAPAQGYVFQADARAQIAIRDYQASAEAHDAKVRRDAIEECIRAVQDKHDAMKKNIMSPSPSSSMFMGFYRAIDALQSLLPEPAEADEKGGEA